MQPSLLLTAWILVATQPPATLVVRAHDGTLSPGIASAWEETPEGLRLTVSAKVDLDKLLAALSLRLPGANAALDARTILVTGLPVATLLEQLAVVRIDDDNWSDLSELTASPPSMAHPTPGGSIRASYGRSDDWSDGEAPTRAASIPADTDVRQRLSARVLSVSRGSFPRVRLELEILGPGPGGGTPALPAKMRVTAEVAFVKKGREIDLYAPATQKNLVSCFLVPGDQVLAHVTGRSPDWIVDVLERTTPPSPSASAPERR